MTLTIQHGTLTHELAAVLPMRANEGPEIAACYERSVNWLPVLMYHRVVDADIGPNPYQLRIQTSNFDAQMAYLSERGYQSIALDDVPLAVTPSSPWKKPVAISFDDGYLDTYTHAYPILKKYKLTATIMLVSDFIGGQSDWDRDREQPAPLLSQDHILEMQQNGMRFGAHGAKHLSLPHIGPDEVRRELRRSKSGLEALLGREVSTLAYPYGRSTPDVRRIAMEVGFSAAFGVERWSDTLDDFSRIDGASCPGCTLVWRLKVSGVYRGLRQNRALRLLNNLGKRIRA